MSRKLLIGLSIFLCATAAHAGATDKLKTFIASTHSAQADFTQLVLDKNGKKIQSASGTMQFVRPGKFRWSYQKPYEQLIVGDGEKFWLYDVDLNQVTVKKLDAALGSSPAALLSGNNEIERSFTLKDSGCDTAREAAGREQPQVATHGSNDQAASCRGGQEREGLDWLEAKPKAQDTSFESMRMAFNAQSELVVMELRDSFGHNTVLRFSSMRRNPQLSPSLFKFVPPKGADVLGGE